MNLPIGWFYVVTAEAQPILLKIFKAGVRPGAVIVIPEEDLAILQKGSLYMPIHIVDNSKIVVPH